MILGFYAGKSHNLIGLRIFMEISTFLISKLSLVTTRDNLEIKKSLDLHEKSLDLSNYEIFQHKILKSQSFKKRAVYWYFYAMVNIFSYTGDNLEIKSLDLHDKSLDLSNYWQKTAECRKCAKTILKNPPKHECALVKCNLRHRICIASIAHW